MDKIYGRYLSSGKNNKVVLQLNLREQDAEQFLSDLAKPHRKAFFHNEKMKYTSNTYQQMIQIPQIQLTKEQMQGDLMNVIMELQNHFHEYGAVKLKSCPQWKPFFSVINKDYQIETSVQKLCQLSIGKPFERKRQHQTIQQFLAKGSLFQKSYKLKFQPAGLTRQSSCENQYWNIIRFTSLKGANIQKRYDIETEYASDLPSERYGSFFPEQGSNNSVDENFNYASSLFNLNNLYKSPSSIIRFTQGTSEMISGIMNPWIYIGMLFSTFCWHVEDLGINSINYNHAGNTKIWYVIPQSDKQKFQQFVLKQIRTKTGLNNINLMVDPALLAKNGIKVYKAYQRPKQYIVTLFNAYRCGFSTGINIGEAVNIINIQSLNMIKNYATLNKNLKQYPFTYEWLIYNNLTNQNVDQNLIRKQYFQIVDKELLIIQSLVSKGYIGDINILMENLKYDRNPCNICKNYQYFSFLKCLNCSKKYCLKDVSSCCNQGFAFVSRKPDQYRQKVVKYVASLTS